MGASKRFGAVQALDNSSFSVERGRVLGFLGPKGAGKTTAMRSAFGLVELDHGEVLWDARPIGLSERLRFGYMPEERGLYPRMPVGEQLAYLGCLHGLDDSAARCAATDWLERLELTEGLHTSSRRRFGRLRHGRGSAFRRVFRCVCCPPVAREVGAQQVLIEQVNVCLERLVEGAPVA